MGKGLPLTLPGRDLALGRSGLEPAARALAARFGEDWRSLASFSSLRGAQSFTYPGRGTPVGEQDRRSCLYHILPQTTLRRNGALKTRPGAQTLAAFDPRNSPGRARGGRRRLGLTLGPVISRQRRQAGGICPLIFSSANSSLPKSDWKQQDPSPAHTHAPLSLYHPRPPPPVPSAVVADLQDAGSRRPAEQPRTSLRAGRRRLPTPCTACCSQVRPRQPPGAVCRVALGRPRKELDSCSFSAPLLRPRWCREGRGDAGDRPQHWDR